MAPHRVCRVRHCAGSTSRLHIAPRTMTYRAPSGTRDPSRLSSLRSRPPACNQRGRSLPHYPRATTLIVRRWAGAGVPAGSQKAGASRNSASVSAPASGTAAAAATAAVTGAAAGDSASRQNQRSASARACRDANGFALALVVQVPAPLKSLALQSRSDRERATTKSDDSEATRRSLFNAMSLRFCASASNCDVFAPLASLRFNPAMHAMESASISVISGPHAMVRWSLGQSAGERGSASCGPRT